MALDLSGIATRAIDAVKATVTPETVTSATAGTMEAYVLKSEQVPDTSQPGRVVSRAFKLMTFRQPTLGERLTIRGASAAVTGVEPVFADGVFKAAIVEAAG